MHNMRVINLAAITCLVLMALVGNCTAQGKSSASSGKLGLGSAAWKVPVDVDHPKNPSQNDWFNMAWETFVAVNWSAVAPSGSNNRGQPDTTKAVGARWKNLLIPTVWLTYRNLSSTMLLYGADPGPWKNHIPLQRGDPAIVPGSTVPGFRPMVLDMLAKISKPLSTGDFFINEAAGGALVDQLGRYTLYDIRLNQSEYTYFWLNGYYNAANQVRAYAAGIKAIPRTGMETMFNPPLPSYAQFGALEVKAAWRVLDSTKDNSSRYFTQVGYFLQPDGITLEGPVKFGLVGLHILRLTPTTPSTWFWATFEQVDNTEVPTGVKRPDGTPLTPSYCPPNTPNGNCDTSYNKSPGRISGNIPWTNTNTPNNVCRVTDIPAGVLTMNKFWRSQLKGTVWQNYELINTINPSVKGGPSYPFAQDTTTPTATINTYLMSNATMETYVQNTSFTPPQMSCLMCHAFAKPQGAPNGITSANQVFTFLFSNADSAGSTGMMRSIFRKK
jgi:hypothetical protein